MKYLSNQSRKNIKYKDTTIPGGSSVLLDNEGNVIDSITDNTKEIKELNTQLQDLLKKGDTENDKLTKQFAEIQDKINQQVDEKLQALEKVMEGSVEKNAAKSALNIVTATYSKYKEVREPIGSFWPNPHFNGAGYDIKLPAKFLEHIMSKYKKTSDKVIAYQLAGIQIGEKTFNYIFGGINANSDTNPLPESGTINLGAGDPKKWNSGNVIYRFVEYFQSDSKTLNYC